MRYEPWKADSVRLKTELVTKCFLCGSEDSKLLCPARDRLHRLPGDFAFVECDQCKLVRLSPRPVMSQIASYYPGDYYSYQVSAWIPSSHKEPVSLRDEIRNSVLSAKGYPVSQLKKWQRLLRPLFVRLFGHRMPDGDGESFPVYHRNARALDIGCGSATFLNLLKQHGWQVIGVDFNPKAAEVAKREFDIDVFVGEIEGAPFEPASFDHIHMSHIIEHLPDPLATMRVVASLLRPGGTIYIETPNVDSFNCRRCGSYWLLWDAPRHLFLFSPDTLLQTLSKAGLRSTRMRTVVQDVYRWEDFFRCEEEQGREIADRIRLQDQPPLRPEARRRAMWLLFLSRLDNFLRPLDGDVIRCWATKN